ncbi:hypothetical protein J2S43_002820 [Catenuloplanes nepalensis]|uniref:MarR family transcriptional regulator n=1 Tax=Catenuloplanes nepalensis TaxID=587533 RepID=A0ABT9MSE3_9ACTN|nr:hypothetical protein [Catenuloplanes nepalensis]MDP9794308.1 hypothetical protein [Catenuloplanes nepalensis]
MRDTSPNVARTIEAAGRVTREMIRTMTGDELRREWIALKRLLDDIMRDPPPSRGGPR